MSYWQKVMTDSVGLFLSITILVLTRYSANGHILLCQKVIEKIACVGENHILRAQASQRRCRLAQVCTLI